MKAEEFRKYCKKNNFENKLIMGIDASSTKCGFAFMKDGVLLRHEYLLLEDDSSLDDETLIYNKSKILEEYINRNIEGVDYIILEDKMKTFNGRTTAETLMKLSYINSVAQFIIKNNDVTMITLHPSTARKQAWGRSKFKDVKKSIIELSMKQYNIEFPLKRKPSKNYVDYADDVCDAITLAKSVSDPYEKHIT